MSQFSRLNFSKMKPKSIWTIGHSTRSLEEFVTILHAFDIELVVDIRSLPGSRKFPQFNKENLEKTLPEVGIIYLHLLNLGGRRKVRKNSHNTGWQLASFRAYADYMETPEFTAAAQELQSLASEKRTAYMCAEAVWWSCHRSLVSDYLKLKGWTVMHIMDTHKATEHPYTQPAVISNNRLTYPPEE